MRTLVHLLPVLLAANLSAQNCTVRLGGAYYENCKSMISVRGNDVLSFGAWADPIGTVNLDVYDTNGGLVAQVKGAKLIKGDPKSFVVKASKGSFTLTEARGSRIICALTKVTATQKENACQVDARLDLYMPGGGFYSFSPEHSSVPFLQGMEGGAFFKNSQMAIVLQ